MAPKRSASASPEPSTAPSDVGSVSSSDGEQLPAQQTTRSGAASFAHALRHDSACDLRQDFTARKTCSKSSAGLRAMAGLQGAWTERLMW
jgi:hypothetical protein